MIITALGIACSNFSIDMDMISEGEIVEWTENGYDPNVIFLEHNDQLTGSNFYKGQELNILYSFDEIGLQAVEVPASVDVMELIAYLRSQDRYHYVEPSLLRSLPTPVIPEIEPFFPGNTTSIQSVTAVDDPYLSWQWHMDLMQVNQISSDYWGRNVTMTVIDSGISVGNDGFNNFMPGGDFINNDDDPNDEGGHGTHVAGTIAQKTNNGYGVRGVAPDVILYGVKVFSPSLVNATTNPGGFSPISYAQAFQFAVENGSDVINLSLGSTSYSSWEESLIQVALDAGIAVVAASGNDASSVGWPAALDGVIAIGSVGNDSSLASYSNYGPEIDFAAPGGGGGTSIDNYVIQEVYDYDNRYSWMSGTNFDPSNDGWYMYPMVGTSMASPHAAGAYAVLIGAGATVSEATTALTATATDLGTAGKDDNFGHGLIQLSDALDYYLDQIASTGPSSGDLIISEIMHNPNGLPDYQGEWFEVYNTTTTAIDLQNMVFSDGGGDSFTIDSSVMVSAGGYVVLAPRSNATGGTIDYVYDRANFALSSSDSIRITSSEAVVLDTVTYDTTYPTAYGASLSLKDLSGTSNDDVSNWCLGLSAYATGDFGTPGSANDTCAADAGTSLDVLSEGDLVISEIMHDPQNAAYYKGEWFEIYNNSGADLNLNGLIVSGYGSETFTVSQDILLTDGEYAVFAARADTNDNGGIPYVDYAYDRTSFRLNTSDQIILTYASATIDQIQYSSSLGFEDASGASLSLYSLDSTDNDDALYWCTASSTFGDGDLGTPGSANDACAISSALDIDSLSAGDLIISEVMHDPLQSIYYKGEWFEIYNNSGSDVNLLNLIVLGVGSESFVVDESILLPDGEFALFAARERAADNGGMNNVDYAYNRGNFRLNASDIISLDNASTTLDYLLYSDLLNFPSGVGTSLMLSSLDADSNDSAAYWCESTSAYGDGDFGTPGTANDTCELSIDSALTVSELIEGDLVVSEIMHNPTTVPDYRGEWFEIYNNSGSDINLEGLVVIGERNGEHFTIDDAFVLPDNEYAVLGARFSNNGGVSVDVTYNRASFKLDLGSIIDLQTPAGVSIDNVTYAPAYGFPVNAGSALSLDVLDTSSNDDASFWCEATSSYGDGDFGTPGTANDVCN
ncbi:MAG: lamin tail domain-containing protein [Myxococcota bacterium]|nr:lamin tail domain-containing protein [Myxococcota bacterium]